jgi:hypothetical protein
MIKAPAERYVFFLSAGAVLPSLFAFFLVGVSRQLHLSFDSDGPFNIRRAREAAMLGKGKKHPMTYRFCQAEPGRQIAKNNGAVYTASSVYSRHALHRAARRSITRSDLDYILTYGRPIQRTGVTFYFLARKDLLAAGSPANQAAHLEGAVVLVSKDREIITVYRNRKALRDIQRKPKYR